ncbi:MAG: PQQ-binding-like beta-propeller repeat protein [Actinobacteria bacterium]|nr:PQQ-binding-like beta-propeller repeat protein [Actinomycetota bacterium]
MVAGNGSGRIFCGAGRSWLLGAATLAVALALALPGAPFAPRASLGEVAAAQSAAPVFESADYRIKDGTGPCIVDGVAYLFAGNDPWMPPGEDSSVVALDAADGSLLWQKDLEWAGGMGSKARPLYDRGRVYIGCGKRVYCLDAQNGGNVLWAADITPAGAPMGDSVIISDPVMYSNAAGTRVVVLGDYIYGRYLGLDAASGAVLWGYDLDPGSSAIGAPGVDDAGNRLYLPQHAAFGSPVNGKVHCLDVSGASPVKKWEFKADFDVAGSIALEDGDLYFSDFAYGGPMSSLYRVEDKGDEAVQVWKQSIWGSSGTPLIDANSGTLFVCGNDYSVGGNHFYAFDRDTGELVWDNPNWGAYNGNCVLSSATGYLYAGSFDTTAWAHNKGVGAVDAYTGSELWYVQEKGGGDPVVANGLVYTTADGRLYAYEEYRPSSYDWYFAEGYTGEGFEEWLCLANPGTDPEDDATVRVTYLFNGERDPKTVDYEVTAGTRTTVDVKGAVGSDVEVSIKVVSDRPVVAERPVYFSYQGMGSHGWTGGHCVVGADEPLTRWYFAEGYTGEGFEEWLCLANFGDRLATVRVSYIYPQGEPLQKEYYVPGNRRVTFSVNREAGEGRDVSIAVESDRPVVAERPMYFSYQGMGAHGWTGGHCVPGAPSPSTSWYFAEGYTGEGFEEWLCLANPGDEDADVDVTYLYQDGQPRTERYRVEAHTRRTLSVNLEAGENRELGMTVRSARPVLAERPVYFNYRGARDGGSCVVGASIPSNYWCLAEGYTDAHFDQYICISNPGKEDAAVKVTPLFGDGKAEEYTVPAGRRFTIPLSSSEPVERAYAVTSDRGVVVERAMYFDYQGLGAHNWTGGHCTRAATLSDIY